MIENFQNQREIEQLIDRLRFSERMRNDRVTFKQFVGYISLDEAKPRFYFYYFVEAESDPSSKPLVLWLNGGPGCSSVGEGAFVEHGPFKPSGS